MIRTLPNGKFTTVLQEVVNNNVLQPGENNIEFKIVGGAGKLKISDVVLHYQRDI
jgi:hypothetical protein